MISCKTTPLGYLKTIVLGGQMKDLFYIIAAGAVFVMFLLSD
jgi:hypothetical protein